jgi:hypothetical protein
MSDETKVPRDEEPRRVDDAVASTRSCFNCAHCSWHVVKDGSGRRAGVCSAPLPAWVDVSLSDDEYMCDGDVDQFDRPHDGTLAEECPLYVRLDDDHH